MSETKREKLKKALKEVRRRAWFCLAVVLFLVTIVVLLRVLVNEDDSDWYVGWTILMVVVEIVASIFGVGVIIELLGTSKMFEDTTKEVARAIVDEFYTMENVKSNKNITDTQLFNFFCDKCIELSGEQREKHVSHVYTNAKKELVDIYIKFNETTHTYEQLKRKDGSSYFKITSDVVAIYVNPGDSSDKSSSRFECEHVDDIVTLKKYRMNGGPDISKDMMQIKTGNGRCVKEFFFEKDLVFNKQRECEVSYTIIWEQSVKDRRSAISPSKSIKNMVHSHKFHGKGFNPNITLFSPSLDQSEPDRCPDSESVTYHVTSREGQAVFSSGCCCYLVDF